MGIATTTQSAAIRELSDQNSQGTRLGASTADLIGFLGATTLTAQSTCVGAVTLAGASAQAATSSGGGTSFGFSSASVATAVLNAVAELKRKGLIA